MTLRNLYVLVTFTTFAALMLLSCGDTLVDTPDGAIATPDAAAGTTCETATADAHVVFLNRFAGTYTNGDSTSPARNETELAMGRDSVLTAWDVSSENFAATKLCLAEVLAPFNVIITDVEPPVEPYHEIVFTSSNSDELTTTSDFTLLADLGGCWPMPGNTISFVFPVNENPITACQFATKTVGYSLGLAPVVEDCEDPMTFTSECGEQVEFLDATQTCGNESPAPCLCHRELSTQNSFQLLTSALGPCPQ